MTSRTRWIAPLLFTGLVSGGPATAQIPSEDLANRSATRAELGPVRAERVDGRSEARARITLTMGRGTTVVAQDVPRDATLALTAIDVAEDRARIVALDVDAAGSRTTYLVDVSTTRPTVLAHLGAFPVDEEHGARLVVQPGPTSATIDVAIEWRARDACGEATVRLHPTRIDRASGRATRLGPMEAGPAPEATLEAIVATSAVAAAPFGELAFDSAIGPDGPTSRGLEGLADADPATRFPIDGTGFGAVRARYPLAPLRLVALVVDPLAGRAGGRDFVVRAGSRSYRVHVPVGTGPVEVRFPNPLDARCLVVERASDEASAIALATLRAIPEAEGTAAVERLVTELADESARADLAAIALARIGTPALEVLGRAFAEAPTPERLRILRAAEALVPREPNALRIFVQALESGDQAAAELALERGLALGGPGHRALAAAVRRGRAEVARALAERAPELAVEAMLARLPGTSGDDEKRTLREALVVALRRNPARTRDAVRAFAAGEGDPSARGVALAALRSVDDDEGAGTALAAWLAATPEAPSVEVQLRWLEAIAGLDPALRTEPMRAMVRGALASDVWMVRERALHAVVGDPDALALLRPRLEDGYPRVRATAARLLDGDAESLRRIAELSRRDAWPQVRLAALQTLRDVPDAEILLRDALTDRSTRVRIGLLEALADAEDDRFLDDAIGIVERDRAPTPVVVAAVRYLDARCTARASEALEATVDRALARDSERNRAIAGAAARALERFGDEEAVRSARRHVDPTRGPGQAPPRCPPPGDAPRGR